jgi:MOSC domain-containing protein YiiM
VRLDDILEIGSAVLQVSQPRFPCFKLGIRMGDQRFLRRFLASRRTGFYCRVLQEGMIATGQVITHRPAGGGSPTIADVVAASAKGA